MKGKMVKAIDKGFVKDLDITMDTELEVMQYGIQYGRNWLFSVKSGKMKEGKYKGHKIGYFDTFATEAEMIEEFNKTFK